jgi:hypothetical protein
MPPGHDQQGRPRGEGMTEQPTGLLPPASTGADASHVHHVVYDLEENPNQLAPDNPNRMRRTATLSRPSGRSAVGLRPSLDPAASSARSHTGSGPKDRPANTLDRPRPFRDDLHKHLGAALLEGLRGCGYGGVCVA